MEEAFTPDKPWYRLDNADDVISPNILVYPDRIENNIRKMVEIAGGTDRLRPHVKTHKIPEIIRLQMNHGINKFKCATISEAEMVAKCGANDIMLAIQPVGPNIRRFFQLQKEFQGAKISCIADCEEVIIQVSDMARSTGIETHVWLDINNGMNRTGVVPGKRAVRLFSRIIDSPMLVAEGLHVYDGHIHEPDIMLRKKLCNDAFAQVTALTDELAMEGIGPIKIVAGGTPTFPVHALRNDVECSPGTTLLWDYKSGSSFADLEFLHAAIILTRIVSKPGPELLCLDLGHKAIASEMPQPRIDFFGLKKYSIVNHSEEHMVIRTPAADKFTTGDPLYGIPWHICPTVDRYDYVTVVKDHKTSGQWNVEARKRKITI
jgi:D-serine deaminase-like pyridoxal phosphate-dependent protein